LNPTFVSFGTLDLGQAGERSIEVQYAGRSDWKIGEVKSPSAWLTPTLTELSRGDGRVGYQLSVKLADGAPAGYMRETLTLVTNDANKTQVPVAVEALVVPPLSVSPDALHLGIVEPGQTVSRTIVVKAKTPFRIVQALATNPALAIKTSGESRNVHLLPVTLNAEGLSGRLTGTIHIQTDLGGGRTVDVPFTVEAAPAA
jgi:hypothetical protein